MDEYRGGEQTRVSMAKRGKSNVWIWVEHGSKYREKDWTNSDLRGVQIYEEEWTGWMKTLVGNRLE